MEQRFTIPGTLPTMNEIIAASKSHFGKYSTMKKASTEMVGWAAKSQGIKPVNTTVIVMIFWYCSNKKTDPDNISAGVKFILDGLVGAGILQNDGWEQIASISHYFTNSDNTHINVHLTPVKREVEE